MTITCERMRLIMKSSLLFHVFMHLHYHVGKREVKHKEQGSF